MLFPNISFGQCQSITPLSVINPSFEGPTGPHITPDPWNTCGLTPDTQPGSWGVNLPASDGNTYVGFVYGSNTYMEGASQQLSGTMIAGANYQFTIDLSATTANGGGINPGPASIEIYGSMTLCGTTELLWTSPMVTTTTWQTYTVNFSPSQDYTHIYFRIPMNSASMTYIMLDNITPIILQDPSLNITSHQTGDGENCSFNIFGTYSEEVITSVELTGNFAGSPLTANLSGSDWDADLSFNSGGVQTITATGFYYDPDTGDEACVYTEIDLDVNAPTIDFAFNEICIGSPISFTNNSVGFGTSVITSSTWNFGDGATSDDFSPTHTYASPGIYDVNLEVTASDGCMSSLTVPVQVHDFPNLDYSIVSACPGEDIVFTNLSTIPNGTINTYTWNFGDGSAQSSEVSPTHIYALEGTYDVTLSAVSDFGCTNSTVEQIEVYSPPQVNFTLENICQGDSSFFINTSNNSNNPIQWSWDYGDGSPITSEIDGAHLYSQPGTFDVMLTGETGNGCSASVTQAVVISNSPNLSFTSNNVCLGTLSPFLNQSTVINGTMDNYTWNFGDGSPESNDVSPDHTFADEGIYTVLLTGTSDSGCTDTIYSQVEVYPVPDIDFTFSSNCLGDSSFFTNTSTVSNNVTVNNFISWSWDYGDGSAVTTATDGVHLYTQDGSFNITLFGETNNGCSNTEVQTINFYPNPEVDFSFENVCHGEPTEFLDASSVTSLFTNNTIDTWHWNFGDNSTSTDEDPVHMYNDFGNYDVTLVLATNNGCMDSITQTVSVYAMPNINGSMNNLCLGEESNFLNLSTINDGNIDTYNWDFGDGSAQSNDFSPSYTYTIEGVYTVTLTGTSNFGCEDSFTSSVEIYPLPEIDFSFSNVCLGDSSLLANTSTVSNDFTNNNFTIWNWDLGDGTTSTQENVNHLYTQIGDCVVTLYGETNNGCSSSITETIQVFPSVDANFTYEDICALGTVDLVSESILSDQNSQSQISSWEWNFGDGSDIDYNENPSHVYSEEGQYDIQLIVRSSDGCEVTVSQQINVFPNPVVSFDAENVCDGETIYFVDGSSVSNQFTSNTIDIWQWNIDDNTTSIYQNPTHLFSTYGDYDVSLVLTTNNGCMDSLTQTVSVYPNPTASFTSVTPTACGELCLDFENTSSIPYTQITETNWTFGTGETSNEFNAENCFYNNSLETMNFDIGLTVVSEYGCSDEILLSDYVSLYPMPLANFTFSPDEITIFDSNVEFQNESLIADNVFWNFGDGISSEVIHPTHVFPNDDEQIFEVCLQVSTNYDCVSEICEYIEISGVNTYYIPNAFTPDGDEYNNTFFPVSFGFSDEDYSFKIFDRWGEIIFESREPNLGWDGNYQGRQMQDGVYTWTLTGKDQFTGNSILEKGHVALIR